MRQKRGSRAASSENIDRPRGFWGIRCCHLAVPASTRTARTDRSNYWGKTKRTMEVDREAGLQQVCYRCPCQSESTVIESTVERSSFRMSLPCSLMWSPNTIKTHILKGSVLHPNNFKMLQCFVISPVLTSSESMVWQPIPAFCPEAPHSSVLLQTTTSALVRNGISPASRKASTQQRIVQWATKVFFLACWHQKCNLGGYWVVLASSLGDSNLWWSDCCEVLVEWNRSNHTKGYFRSNSVAFFSWGSRRLL